MRQVDSERDMNNYFLNKDSTSYEFVTYNTSSEVAYYVNGIILYE